MIFVLYGIIISVATLLGAFVGLGGGVIIKPVLDLIGVHSLQQISFFSACAVFAMSITSTVKHIKSKTPIVTRIVIFLALGSLVGGFLGNKIFNYALSVTNLPNTVRGVQSVLLFLLLIFTLVFLNIKIKRYNIKNPIAIILSGLILGLISSFVGIGGGPINVAFLVLLFSFSMRDAAVYSVATIFFSQISNIITTIVNVGLSGFELKYLWVIVPCAVLGGFFGAILNRKCNEKTVNKIFTVTISLVAVLSLYNAAIAFI